MYQLVMEDLTDSELFVLRSQVEEEAKRRIMDRIKCELLPAPALTGDLIKDIVSYNKTNACGLYTAKLVVEFYRDKDAPAGFARTCKGLHNLRL